MEFVEIKDVERAKKPQRLPVVFTKEEIKVIIDQIDGFKEYILNKGGRGVKSPGDMLWN